MIQEVDMLSFIISEQEDLTHLSYVSSSVTHSISF